MTVTRFARERQLRRFCTVVSIATLGLAAPAVIQSVRAGAEPTPPGAGQFVPMTPSRVVKTTANIGWSGQIQTGETQSVTVTGTNGVPATGVSAVMLHVTTLNATSAAIRSGFLWVWPTGSAKPSIAIVANAGTGYTADNSVIVQVGTDGQVSFANGPSSAPVDVIADVEGYVTSDTTTSAGATFAPLPTTRVLDTQANIGGRSTPLTSAEGAWTYHLAGVGGVPTSGVSAVALNLGAKNTSSDCWVEVQPNGTATNLAYPRVYTYSGYTAQQLAVVPLSAGGDIAFTTNCSSASIYLDVEGYYLTASNGASGDVYVPIESPTRIIDTQTSTGISGQMTAGRSVTGSSAVSVTGIGGVPSSADAVALNLQALNASAGGYNTIWTDGTPQPTQSSSIDVDANVPESNLIFVQTGANGMIDVADPSAAGQSNDLTVDIEGYFIKPALVNELIAGQVTDGGAPVANADVMVFPVDTPAVAESLADNTQEQIVLAGAAKTDSAGYFHINVAAGALSSQYVQPGGTVNFQMVVANSTSEVDWNFGAQLPDPTSPAAPWTETSATDTSAVAIPALTVDFGNAVAYDPTNDPAAAVMDDGITVAGAAARATTVGARSALADSASGTATAAPAAFKEYNSPTSSDSVDNAQPLVGGYGCATTWLAIHRRVPEHFMNVYAWSGAPATVTEEKSTSHTLGVAISTDDSFSHLKADGSATLEFKTVRGGVQGNVVNATMWNYVNYRDNEVTCPFGGPATYHRVPTGLYELMPGINTYTGVVHFHQSGAPHNPPFRWYTENAKNVTYSVGVQFGPFGLSAQSGYGSSDQIEFNFTQFGRICGSNPNGPLVSAQVDTQSGPC